MSDKVDFKHALVAIKPESHNPLDWGMSQDEFNKFANQCARGTFIVMDLAVDDYYWDVYSTEDGTVYDAIDECQFTIIISPDIKS